LENKVPFVAAVSLNDASNPLYVKMTPELGLASDAIPKWAEANLTPGADVLCDGPACFAAVTEAGCTHCARVVGQRKHRDLPQLKWANTVLANLKTMVSGANKAFGYCKHAQTRRPLPRRVRLPIQPALRPRQLGRATRRGRLSGQGQT